MTAAKGKAAIRIVLVEDHTVVREGTRRLLDAEPDLTVVGEAADAVQAVRLADQLWPDVVLLDLRLGGGNSGLEAARKMLRAVPRVAILVLTGLDDPEYVHAALDAGARGYLLKTTTATALSAAVRRVHAGERVLDATISLTPTTGRHISRPKVLDVLSDRERAVLRLLGRGHTNAEIATALGISVRTAEGHVSHLLQKLNLPSRAADICYGTRQRLSDGNLG